LPARHQARVGYVFALRWAWGFPPRARFWFDSGRLDTIANISAASAVASPPGGDWHGEAAQAVQRLGGCPMPDIMEKTLCCVRHSYGETSFGVMAAEQPPSFAKMALSSWRRR